MDVEKREPSWPPGTTGIAGVEMGWKYGDEGRIVIYGAIAVGEK